MKMTFWVKRIVLERKCVMCVCVYASVCLSVCLKIGCPSNSNVSCLMDKPYCS